MKKISIEDKKVSLKDLEISNVDYPKKMLVDFSQAIVRYEQSVVNGERVNTDVVSKIVLNCKNAVVAKKLAELNIDDNALQNIEVSILEDFDYTLDLIKREVVAEIELTKAKIKLLWVQRGSGGSYGDVQLVCDSYKILEESK
jgi:hypothetical protein